MKEILAVIPARGGSKGIPRKNIKLLAGKPLIAHTIEAAKNSICSRVVVSTDDKEIGEIALKYGAEVVWRPKEISGDLSSSEQALLHVLEKKKKKNYSPDLLVFLQCTAPLTTSEDINKTIEVLQDENADSAFAAVDFHYFLWKKNKEGVIGINHDKMKRLMRQEKEPQYKEAGAVYVMDTKGFLKHKHRFFGKTVMYKMPLERNLEIDEPVDFKIAEMFINENKSTFSHSIKLILFDVDGVFTDGSVYLDENGKENLRFSRIDGKGIELLRNSGYKIGIISAEDSSIVKKRMEKLKIKEIHLGIKDKLSLYKNLKSKYSLSDKEIAFCGDDVQDIPVLQKVGLGFCPLNAQEDVKKICHYRSSFKGGEGFVRDVANFLIKNDKNKR